MSATKADIKGILDLAVEPPIADLMYVDGALTVLVQRDAHPSSALFRSVVIEHIER